MYCIYVYMSYQKKATITCKKNNAAHIVMFFLFLESSNRFAIFSFLSFSIFFPFCVTLSEEKQTNVFLILLQVVVECGEKLPSEWSAQQTAALLLSMRTLTDTLHKYQLKGRRMSQRCV